MGIYVSLKSYCCICRPPPLTAPGPGPALELTSRLSGMTAALTTRVVSVASAAGASGAAAGDTSGQERAPRQ